MDWNLAKSVQCMRRRLGCVVKTFAPIIVIAMAGTAWSAPENDHLTNAIKITSVKGRLTGFTTGATTQPGEPLPKFVPSATNTVWYVWIMPESGMAWVNTEWPSIDTVMGVYTLSGDSLVKVDENDDIGAGLRTSRCKFKATAGTHYYIAISGKGNDGQGSFWMGWLLTPVNDNFEDAILYYKTKSGHVSGSTVRATTQTGEPLPKYSSGATNTIWWAWIAPDDGYVTFDTVDSDFDTVMGIYTGTSVSSLTVVTENDDDGSETSLCGFRAAKDTKYYIAVSGWGNSQGTVMLKWLQRPVNDGFGYATEISGGSGYVLGSTKDATAQAGEPLPKFSPGATNTVWWVWTAPGTGEVVFQTTDSVFDTVMGVYTGTTLSSLTVVKEDDDLGPSDTSICRFDAIGGTTYYIAVSGWGNSQGVVRLGWSFKPGNDNFANAVECIGSPAYVSATTMGATVESGEPLPKFRYSATNTVWWSWIAPDNGTATFHTTNSTFDTVMGIYTGTSVSSLTTVCQDDDSGDNGPHYTSLCNFNASKGTKYYIAVSGRDGESGTVKLSWQFVASEAGYKVTFGKNGGTGGDNQVTATFGQPMPTPRTAPKKDGWTFDGYWDTLKAGGKQYYDKDMKSVRNWDKKAATTLWAKWSNKVMFGKNGGTGGDDYVTATEGQPMPTPRRYPDKKGWVFDGYWDTVKEGGKQYYDAEMKSMRNWDMKGSVTLWAKWHEAAPPMRVTFGKNEGTGGDDYVTVTEGQPMPTPRKAPTKSGWTFDGYWDSVKADVNGSPLGKQYYDKDMKSVRKWDRRGAVTLWAKWTVKVTLGKNGGTGGDNYVTATYGQPFPKRTMPTKPGYDFGGYWMSASKREGQCYNANGTGTASMVWKTGGSPTIWALWTAKGKSAKLYAPSRQAGTGAASPAAAPCPAPAPDIYVGTLADGTGEFTLEVGDGWAFVVVATERDAPVAAECEVIDDSDGEIVVVTEDGAVYRLVQDGE